MPITADEARALFDDPDLGVRRVEAANAAATIAATIEEITLDHEDVLDLLEQAGGECVALGPDAVVTRGAVQKGARRPAAWWVHKGSLFLAEIACAEPALWIEVEPTREGIARAVALLSPPEDAREKSFRFFLGLLPSFARDFVNLENRLTVDPFCEGLPLVLGTAAPKDEDDSMTDPLHVSQFETLRSKSRIAVTALHELMDQGSLVIGTVEYRPAPWAKIVETWNAKQSSDWPADLPLDVLGAVGFSNGASLRQVESWLEGEGDGLPGPFALLVGTALINAPGPIVGEPQEVEAFLRRHVKHADPDVRGMIGELAAMFELAALFEEVLEAESDPRVKAALEARRAGAGAP
jgi:hypothetical protein